MKKNIYQQVMGLVLLLLFLCDLGICDQYRAKYVRGGVNTNMGSTNIIYLFNMTIYKEKVVPAYQSLMTENDPNKLIALLKQEASPKSTTHIEKTPLLWEGEIYDEALQKLDLIKTKLGRSEIKTIKEDSYLSSYITVQLLPMIVEAICIVRNRTALYSFDLNNSKLSSYLFTHSNWIYNLALLNYDVKGAELEFPIGEWSITFTKDEEREFLKQLEAMPVLSQNNKQLSAQLDELNKMVNFSVENADIVLVLCLL